MRSAEALVASALDLLGPERADRVLELYCGVGNFTFALAGLGGSVTAVETSAVALGLAQRSVRESRTANVRLVQGEALKVAQGLASEGSKFNRLLLDPPRTGAPGVGALARGLKADRVVYVACDAASLARDAKELRAESVELEAVQLVDLFPQTHHVEVVAAFARGNAGR